MNAAFLRPSFRLALLTAGYVVLSLPAAADDEPGRKPRVEEREGAKRGPRDGDGEGAKRGPRDGEGEGAKRGPRDGEGEGAKRGPREGEGMKRESAEREGGRAREGEAEKAGAAQQMVITVNAVGDVVNSKGDVIPLNQVRGKMSRLHQDQPNQKLILRAAADTPYAKVLGVVDALKDSGFKDVKLEQGQ
jgi:hypothetical protein